MAQCTAPIRGHRTAAAAAACPVCGGRRSYSRYPSFSFSESRVSTGSSYGALKGGAKKKAKWSPVGSTVLYTAAEEPAAEPEKPAEKKPEKYDLFLCHAWDDRKGAAKELYEKLIALGVSVWFSEKNLPLGSTMLREIDKGLAKSRAGIVLVTPAFLRRISEEGVADKELSALLAKDRLIPIVHNTTYDALRDVSPLLGSRSGLDTNEDSMDEIVEKLSELFTDEQNGDD